MKYFGSLLFVLAVALTAPLQATTDSQVGPVKLNFGASASEFASHLPSDVTLSAPVSGSGREIVDLMQGEVLLSILTFDSGRLVRSTRIIEPQDFSSAPAEVLAKSIVTTLTAWPPGEPLQVEANDLAEGGDELQELVFRSGLRRLVLTRSAQLTQLVEHVGTLNE
jgi:hypothetical protein